MSYSPERISSYRRHFEGSTSSLAVQVRVSSPSPVRRDAQRRSGSYSAAAVSSLRAGSMGLRSFSSSRKLPMVGANSGALSVSFGMQAPIDLDGAAAENQEFRSTRTSERKEMVLLNDRLAIYIEKVRSLEHHNKLLETEIESMKDRYVRPSGLRTLYEEQLKELERIANQMKVQRDLAVAAKEAMAGQLDIFKVKYEEALQQRLQAERDVEAFRPDVDKATSARIALEKQLEQLTIDIEFLQRIQKQEIEDLMKQIYAAHSTTQGGFALPDLSAALKQIQAQYDDIAAKNLQEMDAWYGSKFEDLTNSSTKNLEKVRGAREEINSAKKDIQNKERDLDALRTKGEALEAQIREARERHRKEQAELHARIEVLQSELKSIKEKMALLLREYQELLNVKMSLELEITTYRKLIEGEDSRLTGMVQNLSLMSSSMSAVSTSVSVSTAVGSTEGGAGGLSRVLGGSLAGGVAAGLGGGLGGGMGSGVKRSDASSNEVRSLGMSAEDAASNSGGSLGTSGKDVAGSGGASFGISGKDVTGNDGGSLVIDGNVGSSKNAGIIVKAGGKGGCCNCNSIANGVAIVEVDEQAVEVTERKTMLVRTVRTEDVLERDTMEQTVIITGAGDDADFD